MQEKEISFSLKDFRRWIKDNNSDSIVIFGENSLKVGDQVLIYLSEKNIVPKLKPFNEKIEVELIPLIKENGCIIESFNGPNAVVKILGTDKKLNVPKLFLRHPKKREED